jgi:hypothetical protein
MSKRPAQHQLLWSAVSSGWDKKTSSAEVKIFKASCVRIRIYDLSTHILLSPIHVIPPFPMQVQLANARLRQCKAEAPHSSKNEPQLTALPLADLAQRSLTPIGLHVTS